MKTSGVIRLWLNALEAPATEREDAVLAALDRTVSGGSPQLIDLYRTQLAGRLPESPFRSRLLHHLNASQSH